MWKDDFRELTGEKIPEQIDWLSKRDTSEMRDREPAFSGFPTIPVESIHKLPTIACEILRKWQHVMLRDSVDIVNDGILLLALAHLYKACRYYGLVSEWHDMEFVCVIQDGKQPLVTKTHAKVDPHAVARHYPMALGVSATAFVSAGNKWQKLPHVKNMTEKGRRTVREAHWQVASRTPMSTPWSAAETSNGTLY